MQDAPVTVHSSGGVGALASAAVVLALGVGALVRSGPGLGSLVVSALGVLLVGAVLLDRPTRTEVTEAGLRRVCPLRTATLPWSAVIAIERTRAPRWRDAASGGLVARTRRGRWLLSDRAEPRVTYDALVQRVNEFAPGVRVVARPPTERT